MPGRGPGFRTVFGMEAFDGGLNTRMEPGQVHPTESPDCLNVIFDDRSVKTREGTSILNTAAVGSYVCDGLFTATYSDDTQSLIGFWDDAAYVLSGTTFQTIGSSQGLYSGGTRVEATMYQDIIFFGQGIEPYKYNGTEFTRHGVDEPTNTISAVTGGTAGGNLNGTYSYKVAYVNSYAAVGDLSSGAVTVTAANEDVVLTSLPVAPQSFGVAQRYIYRTDNGGSTYKYIDTVADNTTTTYNDNIASASAGAAADTDAGKPPNWRYAITFQDRIFCVETGSEASYLWFSNLGNPFIFASTNFIRVDRGAGERIKGIAAHGNTVLVYKENSVYSIYMPDTTASNWILTKTDAKYGAASHRALIDFQGSQMYLGIKNSKITGFYKMMGSLNEPVGQNFVSSNLFGDDASDRIEDDIFDLQESYMENAAGVEFKNKLYFAVTKGSGNTTNNRIYLFDFHRRTGGSDVVAAWSPWSGINAAMFAVYNNNLYVGSSTANGFVYQLEDGTYTDNGSAIDSYYWTKEFDESQRDRDYEKDFRTAHFEVENTGDWNMGILYRTDSESATGNLTEINLDQGGNNWNTLVWGTDNWDAGTSRKNVKINLSGSRGKRIQFRFDNRNTASRWFKVVRGRFYYNRRGLR
jgi:hypothetical protein